MKQGAGWGTALLLAAAAFFGISSQSGEKRGVSEAGAIQQKEVAAHSREAKKGNSGPGPCDEIEERLEAFLTVENLQGVAPASCRDGNVARKTERAKKVDALGGRANRLRFVIATLPDPVHTQFPLSFDRAAEAIQQGATDEGYLYDSSWMPWESSGHSNSGSAEEETEHRRRENQPGIMLFRRDYDSTNIGPAKDIADSPYADGLVLFVVGEEATQGIHRSQFENAIAWVAALRPPANSGAPGYQILGPSFSGSLPSLAHLLTDPARSGAPKSSPRLPVAVFSGGVTSGRARRGLATPLAARSTSRAFRKKRKRY